jgi:predicted amidohydrolase YtcJ
MSIRVAVALILALASAAAAQRTLYTHGNIYTGDAARPRAEAMLVDGSRLVAVGSEAEVRAAAGGAAAIDLEGRTVLPGLIDAHGHVQGLGSFGLGVLELSRARSFDEVVAKVVETSKEAPGTGWILGGRWDHESWSSRELPTHQSLSQAVPDRPVWLRRVDGHAGIANQKAMDLAGVTRDTPNPPGGEVVRDGSGRPTGVFVDNAMSLITRALPADGVASTEALILKAQEMCLAAGLTGVHDMGVSPAEIAVYQRLAAEGKLKLRIYALVSGPFAMKWFAEHEPIVGERLTVRAAKLYMDGAMGSRGAWLLEPYADRPTGPDGKPYTGLAVSTPDFIEAVARQALEHGFQVCTHAIGDRGNREVLDAYQRALDARATSSPRPDHRFRVEHAQLLSPQDIPRFAALGVIPSMQPTHCTSDMRWVDARVGPERSVGAYAWASLLRTGARIAAGSDFPVESHNPFLGFYAAVTRQNEDGAPDGGWHPRERMTRDETLRAFTLDAAYASFEEAQRGTLAPGKWADFVVIDRDVMTCEPRQIIQTRVIRTVIAGETVYQATGTVPG